MKRIKKQYKHVDILGWKFTITPMRFVLTAIALLSFAVMLVRFITGYSLVTNLTDESPWGYGLLSML